MTGRVLSKPPAAAFFLAVACTLLLFGSLAAGQNAPSSEPAKAQLDYEFFKERVQPIFLKQRWPNHARCYVCHQTAHHGGGPLSLQQLNTGASDWTEEQSRLNFEAVSKVVTPGDPQASLFLRMPLAPEAGGMADAHQGGRQFESQNDPDWQNMKAWVLGQKLAGAAGN